MRNLCTFQTTHKFAVRMEGAGDATAEERVSPVRGGDREQRVRLGRRFERQGGRG